MFGANKPPFGGNTTFGTGNTSFGGSTPGAGGFGTGSAFGQSTPSGGLFGANTSTSSGGGLFGGGGGATSTFGQSGNTGGFSFGAKTTSASGLFGASSSTSTGGGLFSTPSSSTSFGGGSAFGSGANKPLFGSSTGSSLFGQSSAASTPFGQTSTQSGGGLFGSTPASGGLFGSSQQQQNGTTIKFTPTAGTDTMVKNGITTNVNTKHQVITAMKEYTSKSFEELRVEDYLANRKGGSSGGGLLGATGTVQTDNKTTGLFGPTASSASTGFSFGQQNKSTFGSAPTSFATGSAGGLFGSNTSQQQQQQSGGLFGGGNKPIFGQTATNTATGGGLFGASSSGSSLFGQNQNQSKSIFGATTQAGGTGLFGSTPASGAATAFGGGGFGATGFGQQSQGGIFGKTGSSFGTATSNPSLGLSTGSSAGGLFGSTSKPGLTLGTNTGGGFGFGAGTGVGSSLFGNKPAATGFGSTSLTGGSFGSSLGSNFGTGNTGSLFGANKPTGLGTTFGGTGGLGGGFGGTSGLGGGGLATGGLGGQAANQGQNAQVQQQLMTLFNSPYGDNPLFKNILVDSDKKKNDLPTSSSQKSLNSPSHYKVSSRPGAKLRPKPLQRGAGKSKLFDGLEEEDNTLNSETFVTRRSIKKLVIKNRSPLNETRNDTLGTRTSVKPDELSSPLPVYPKDHTNVSIHATPDREDSIPSRHTPGDANTPEIPLFTKPKVLADTSAMDSPSGKHEDPDCTIQALNSQPSRSQRPPSGSGDPPVISLTPGGSTTTPPSSARGLGNQSRTSTGDLSYDQSGEEEIFDQENQPPPHPAKILLRRPGYYTIPTLEELADMTDDAGNCVVQDFTVGRERYGSVFFPGVTNVKGLNLDEIVHFRRKEITIYPDDTCKPEVGTGLNKKAEVTLDQTWPIDKSNRQPIKDPERLRGLEYEERLERATSKLGAKFIEYRPETGSWVFQVQHFSKYGLTDSDEEEGAQPQQQGQKPVKKIEKVPAKDPSKIPPAKQTEEKQKSRAPLQENGSIQMQPDEPMRNGFDLDMDVVPDRAVPRMRGLGGQIIQDRFMAGDGDGGDSDTYMPYDGADRDMQSQPEVIDGESVRSLDVSHRLADALGMSSHRMQVMKASFFGEEDDHLDYGHSGAFVRAPGVDDADRSSLRPTREPLIEKETMGDMWQTNAMGSPAKYLAGMSKPVTRGSMASPIPRFLRESMDARDTSQLGLSKSYLGSPHPAPLIPSAMSPREKLPKVVGSRPHLGLVPIEQSMACNRHDHIADTGLMMGRSFRVGWGPNWTLVHSGKAVGVEGFRPKVKEEPMPFTLLTSKSVTKPTTESSPFKVTLEKVNIAPLIGKPQQFLAMYEKSLAVELEHSLCATDQLCPAFAPQPGIEALHKYAKVSVRDQREGTGDNSELLEHTRLVWRLMTALWGQLPEEEGKGAFNSSSYEYRKARRKALSRWLSDACRKHIENEVQDSKFRHLGHVEAIFALLTGQQINEACVRAQESGDHRLAFLLAQAGTTHDTRHLVTTQLIHWEQLRADQFVSDEHLKVYSLLGGQLVWGSSRGEVNVCEDLDWKRALAVHLWYHSTQEASISDALQAYEEGFTGKSARGDYCLPPRPPYMESNPGFYQEDLSALESMDEGDGLVPRSSRRFPVWDMCYHLLKLYSDRTHLMHNVLAPTAHSPYQLDYRLSWHVLQVLEALGYSHLSPQCQAHLHISFASQLESIGLWHWSAFVLLHIPDNHSREHLLRSLLRRHVTLEVTGDNLSTRERFVKDHLNVPVEWIHDAKALRALYEGREREEAWHLLRAGRWNDCHQVLIRKIAADAIISESYGFLKGVLDELNDPERSALIQDWSTNGQVYLDFININKRLEELRQREPSTFEMEKLHPDIASLCLRVGGVYSQTVKDRVCRSEMAKRTANMMKVVLTIQQESLANAGGSLPVQGLNPLIPSRLLAPHVTKLPLPEDYSLQELRQLTRSYMQELTA